MSKFARIENNMVQDVFTPPEGVTLAECFHPDVAALFTPCPDNVTIGSTVDANGKWIIAGESEPVPELIAYHKVGPIHFQMLFMPAETVAANDLKATDKVIASFFKLIDDPRTDEVDLGLSSVQNAIEYTLTAVKEAGVDIDVAARKAEILSGVLK